MTSVPGSKMPDKDVELDKRMEAIRKKNEAIMKRYAEIQADKQHAEAEGMAIDLKAPPSPSRPPFRGGSQRRSSDEGKRLGGGNWATRDKERQRKDSDEDRKQQEMTHNDPAMRKPKGVPPRQDPQMDYPPVSGRDVRGFRGRGRGRGRGDRSSQPTLQDKRCQEREENRRLNIEKMSEEMEQIADYERGQRDGRSEKNPVRNFLDDSWRSGPISSRGDRRQDSRRHRTNWGGADFEHVKTGMDRQRRQRQDGWARSDGMSSEMHMQLSMTGRERVEYARWKHEREVIDRERLSRHRNAAGEWRREWDANKSENMFRETAGGAETDNADGNVYQDKPRSPRPHNLGAFMSRPQLQNPAGRNRDYSMHDERWRDDTPAPSSEDVLQPVPADRPVHNQGRGRDDIPEGSDGGAVTAAVACDDETTMTVPVSVMKPPRGRSTKAMRPKEQRTLRGQPARHLDLPERDPVIEGCERSQLDTGVKPSTLISSISPGNDYQSVGDWADLVDSVSPQTYDLSPPRSDAPTFINSTLLSHSADCSAASQSLETMMPREERDVEGAAETECDNPVEEETPTNVQTLKAEEHHEAAPDGCSSPGDRNTFVLEHAITQNDLSSSIPVEISSLDVPQPEVLAHANMEETMEGVHNISSNLHEVSSHPTLLPQQEHGISQSDDALKDAEPPLLARCANVDGEDDIVSKQTDITVCEKKPCITEGKEAEHIPVEEDCSAGPRLADSEEVCCSNENPSAGNAENVNAELIEPAEGLGVGGDLTVQENLSVEKNEASPGFEVSVPPADDEGESKTNVTQEGDLELSTDKVTEQTEDVSIDTQDKVAE